MSFIPHSPDDLHYLARTPKPEVSVITTLATFLPVLDRPQTQLFVMLVKHQACLSAAFLYIPPTRRLQLSEWDDAQLRALGPWKAILSRPVTPDMRFDGAFNTRCEHALTAARAVMIACINTFHAAAPA